MTGNDQMAADSSGGGRSDTLALLYQGLFTAIVRIQARRQPLPNLETLRRRMKSALQDAQRDAATAGYAAQDIRDAEFAVVAFLDEVILSLKETAREQWAKKTLNVELYGEAIAGEVFFDKLRGISERNDSPQTADLLEVYLLCLLLGFEGRYSGALRSELFLIAERLRRRIEVIRSTDYKLSPSLRIAEAVKAPERVTRSGQRDWLWWAAGPVGIAAVLFVLYWLHLTWRLSDIRSLVAGAQ